LIYGRTNTKINKIYYKMFFYLMKQKFK